MRVILKKKKNKYEKICRYASGKYHIKPQVYLTSTDYEVNAVINALEGFKLFLINKIETTIRIDCEAISLIVSQELLVQPFSQAISNPLLMARSVF